MYLVELRPGKEELYRTGDDLAAAIRSGEVDGHSRIYHRSTSKWISITLHPQYKAIVAEKPAKPGDKNSWTYLTAQAETLESAVPDPDAADPASDAHREDGEHGGDDTPWRRPLALGISGLFLIFGIQLAFSGPRPSWSARTAAATSDAPAAPAAPAAAAEPASTSQMVSLASTAWSEPPAEPEAAAERPAPVDKTPAALPKAPQLAARSMEMTVPAAEDAAVVADGKSIEGLLASYDDAYQSARSRLATGVRVARLDHLFASTRLTPDGGVTDTRLGLAGVANFIRVYREREGAIEREYQDSFTTLSKDLGWSPKVAKRWYSRENGKESPALAQLTERLLAGIDSVLAVLSAEAGAYKLQNNKIHFEDIAASREYGELRRSINATVDAARIAGGEESAGPMGYLLKAIGTTRLPQEI
jgi:hypothetical protein